eukprot:1161480-Pelagomonas_calceolata.AAC.3
MQHRLDHAQWLVLSRAALANLFTSQGIKEGVHRQQHRLCVCVCVCMLSTCQMHSQSTLHQQPCTLLKANVCRCAEGLSAQERGSTYELRDFIGARKGGVTSCTTRHAISHTGRQATAFIRSQAAHKACHFSYTERQATAFIGFQAAHKACHF